MKWFIAMAALSLIGCKGTEPVGIDEDGDGSLAADDCDDNNPEVSPTQVERCNGIDDNCDGAIDEGLTLTFYADTDGDSYGDPAGGMEACSQPEAFVLNDGDCDDSDFNTSPDSVEQCDDIDHNCDGDPFLNALGGEFYWRDADGDGFGDESTEERSCAVPDGFVLATGEPDCDDTDVLTNPGADEICGTADRDVDDDCNGLVNDSPVDGQPFPLDRDNDGFGNVNDLGMVCAAGDQVDTDNDGLVDTRTTTYELATDCDDTTSSVRPGVPELCDGIDNDCDPLTPEDDFATDADTWYADTDADGSGNPAVTQVACTQPAGYANATAGEDCDDSDPLRSPSQPEVCDSIDNDCNGALDDNATDASTWYLDFDGDGLGDPSINGQLNCTQPPTRVDNDLDCDDNDAAVLGEITYYADVDLDTYGDANVSIDSCDPVTGYVLSNADCDDTDDSLNPLTPWYFDGDMDGYGLTADVVNICEQPVGRVRLDNDCDDLDDLINPGVVDGPDTNNVDDDCDGDVDEDTVVDHCGQITTDEVWGGSSIHTIACNVFIGGAGQPHVRIQPGAIVRFVDGASISVGVTGNGSLSAGELDDGVLPAELPVRFEHDNRGNPGRWNGIIFGANGTSTANRLSNVDIVDASGAGVEISGSAILENVSISDTIGPAIELSGSGRLSLVDSTLMLNQGGGIFAVNSNPQLDLFSNNMITSNLGRPITISAESLPELDVGSTYDGNTDDVIGLLSGDLAEDAVLRASFGVDYEVDGEFSVGDGSNPQLTVENNVTTLFTQNSSLEIGSNGQPGSLVVSGVATANGGADDCVGFDYGVVFDSVDGTPGTWDGIAIGVDAQDSSITGASIVNAGSNNRANLWVNGNLSDDPEDRVTVTLSQVRLGESSESGLDANYSTIVADEARFCNNQSMGFELKEDVLKEASSITNSTSMRNDDSGAKVYPTLVPTLDGNNFYGDNDLPIEVTTGIVVGEDTWNELTEDYYVSGAVRIQNGNEAIVTVAAGVSVYFGPTGELIAGLGDQGSLIVNGTLGNEVLFTALAEVTVGTPVRGAWPGITTGTNQRQSEFNHLTVRYAGSDNDDGAITFIGPSTQPIHLDNVVVEESGSHGVLGAALGVNGGQEVCVNNSTFSNNDDIGFYLASGGLQATSDLPANTPCFEDNFIQFNDRHGLGFEVSAVSGIGLNNTISNNNLVLPGTPDFIEMIGGNISSDQTWSNLGLPYRLTDSSLRIRDGGVLTIDPGVTVQVDDTLEIIVGRNDLPGGIIAQGTLAMPITFTSSQASPSQGDWVGVALGEECLTGDQFGTPPVESSCVLDYVTIQYAGDTTLRADRAALDIYVREPLAQPDPVLVTHTVVRDSLSSGVDYYWDNATAPKPGGELPDIPFLLFACEDLDGDRICDGTNNYCFDDALQRHGTTNYFCDNSDSNFFARDSSNPYSFHLCPSLGPTQCPVTLPAGLPTP